jgi:transposase-like protein
MPSISKSKTGRRLNQGTAGDLCYTIADLNREFPNDDACLEYIKNHRWPNGVTKCEKCDIERKHYRVTGRTAYACDRCGNHIYPLKGTVFARSTTSLKTWFYVIYLMVSTGRGIPAKRIQRETGVTYKTAWRTVRQIRLLMVNEPLPSGRPMIEIDSPTVLSIRQDQGPDAPRMPGKDMAASSFESELNRTESM